MADFRYGFFHRPDNKKTESHPEETRKTSHVHDHKSKPEERRQPISVLPGTRYVTTTEKYTEEFNLRSRDDESQHSHAKKYEPVNKQYDFTKLIAKVPRDASQPKHHGMSLSEPMNDIHKAIEFFKEVVNLHSSKNPHPTSDDHPKKYDYAETIDSNEAARKYGNLGAPRPVLGGNVATIDCKEAARKYKGATV